MASVMRHTCTKHYRVIKCLRPIAAQQRITLAKSINAYKTPDQWKELNQMMINYLDGYDNRYVDHECLASWPKSYEHI